MGNWCGVVWGNGFRGLFCDVIVYGLCVSLTAWAAPSLALALSFNAVYFSSLLRRDGAPLRCRYAPPKTTRRPRGRPRHERAGKGATELRWIFDVFFLSTISCELEKEATKLHWGWEARRAWHD